MQIHVIKNLFEYNFVFKKIENNSTLYIINNNSYIKNVFNYFKNWNSKEF